MNNPLTELPCLVHLAVQLPMTAIWVNKCWQYVPEKNRRTIPRVPNVFDTADDILIARCDDLGKDCYVTLDKILIICREAKLKLNKDKCLVRCTSIPFFGEIILWDGVTPVPREVQALICQCQKGLQLFLGIVNYLSEFTLANAEVCGPLRKLTLVKAECSWNRMYQN